MDFWAFELTICNPSSQFHEALWQLDHRWQIILLFYAYNPKTTGKGSSFQLGVFSVLLAVGPVIFTIQYCVPAQLLLVCPFLNELWSFGVKTAFLERTMSSKILRHFLNWITFHSSKYPKYQVTFLINIIIVYRHQIIQISTFIIAFIHISLGIFRKLGQEQYWNMLNAAATAKGGWT